MILVFTWHINGVVGSQVQEDAEEIAKRGYEVIVLHPWHHDIGSKRRNVFYQSVAITIKDNTNIVTSVISALGDFARVLSRLIHELYDPNQVKLILSYEWSGALLGFFAKEYLKRPMITSVNSVESMRTSEKSLLSLSVRGLEMRFLHASDLIVARTEEAIVRVLNEYRIPSDRVRLSLSPAHTASIVEEVLRAFESTDV
ncbi:MAG: glycosyltransferase [Candidatus Nezhaarchaeales archaeon]